MNLTPATVPTHPYTIFLNKREMGTIYSRDIKAYMDRFFPGASFKVLKDGKTVKATASVVQLLEIKEARIRAHVIND